MMISEQKAGKSRQKEVPEKRKQEEFKTPAKA